MDRCAGIKKDGKQCENHGKHIEAVSQRRFCGHHVKQMKEEKEEKKEKKPISSSSTLPPPSTQLRLAVAEKLKTRLLRGPAAKSDSPGYLYVYSLAGEEGMNYWKIGMTTRTMTERKKEWQSKHPNHTLVLKEYYYLPTPVIKFLERVVHLYLDHKRMYRYPVGKLLISVWSATGEQIHDANWKQQKEPAKLKALGKMIEWFCIPWEEVSPLLDALVKFYSAPVPVAH